MKLPNKFTVLDPGSMEGKPFQEGKKVTAKQLCDFAGSGMDASCTADIMGSNLLLGSDGKFYTCVIEMEIAPAAPNFILDTLNEHVEEAHDEGEELSLFRCAKGKKCLALKALKELTREAAE